MERSFEDGSIAMSKLAVEEEGRPGEDRNESTTRLALIDSLLFDILGWRRDQCVTEEPLDGTYTDYSLGHPGTVLIVEAKKEGLYFSLPASERPIVVSLASLVRGNTGLAKAVRQTSGYCLSRGVKMAVVTNGWQLVASLEVEMTVLRR